MSGENRLDQEPRAEDFESVRDYLAAHEDYHDQRVPDASLNADRAVRLASESMRAILMQIRRVQGEEPEDAEWLLRVGMDYQFLVVALWRLRMAASMVRPYAAAVDDALTSFDQALPDLKRMRDVAQHIDEYAVDGPGRRHKRTDGSRLGRRSLEVEVLGNDRYHWLGGTIEVRQAREAAQRLYSAIRQARDGVTA